MRCLALANALAKHGAQTTFLAAQITDALAARVMEAGHQLEILRSSRTKAYSPEAAPLFHASWLKSGWKQDAQTTIAVIEHMRPEWIVVDHYALDWRWHQMLRQHLKDSECGILAIDDLGDRDFDCDVLLDPNFRKDGHDLFHERVPAHCKRFKGAQMALLDTAYAQAHSQTIPRKTLRHILIYFGVASVSTFNPILEAMQSVPDVTAQLVTEKDTVFDPRLISHPSVQAGQVALHGPMPSLLPAMQNADLAIGPIGSSTWERMCLGLPTIGVTLAQNQEAIARDLHEAGLIYLLGRSEDLSADDYVAALTLMARQRCLADLSRRCLNICDGLGAERLAAYLVGHQPVVRYSAKRSL